MLANSSKFCCVLFVLNFGGFCSYITDTFVLVAFYLFLNVRTVDLDLLV